MLWKEYSRCSSLPFWNGSSGALLFSMLQELERHWHFKISKALLAIPSQIFPWLFLILTITQCGCKGTYPNMRDSKASSFVCHTMCLWRKNRTWHRRCREKTTNNNSVHAFSTSTDLKRIRWTKLIKDSQSAVFCSNFSIYWGESEGSVWGWGNGKLNFVFTWSIYTATSLIGSWYCCKRECTCLAAG